MTAGVCCYWKSGLAPAFSPLALRGIKQPSSAAPLVVLPPLLLLLRGIDSVNNYMHHKRQNWKKKSIEPWR